MRLKIVSSRMSRVYAVGRGARVAVLGGGSAAGSGGGGRRWSRPGPCSEQPGSGLQARASEVRLGPASSVAGGPLEVGHREEGGQRHARLRQRRGTSRLAVDDADGGVDDRPV